MAARKVMYIGNKPTKVDNVNNNELRVWDGLGDVLAVSQVERDKLCMHRDVWVDVTDMTTEQITDLIEKKREHFRSREREQHKKHIAKVLGSVSLDELQAEIKLRERVASFSKAPESSVLKVRDVGGLYTDPLPKTKPGADESVRPKETAKLGEDIQGAIFAIMDDERCMDEEGQPLLAPVNARLGYKITEDELAAVWAEMNAPKGK